MNETRICANCGIEHPLDTMYRVEGDWLCESCADRLTVVCDHCNERIYEENAVEDDHYILCDHCFDEYYIRCEDCGRIISRDRAYWDNDDNAYCASCWDEHNDIIHEYNYTPDLVFHGKGLRHFGVELEIDNGGTVNNNAQKLLDIANASAENLYIKTDGSLDDGMELVTHPMSLDYHCNEMPWEDICHEAVVMGYRSHKTSTCGLHVHVNRNFFGDDRDEQEIGISRVLFFVERFWQELLKFSRRTEAQINRWAARYGMKDKPKEIMDHAKKQNNGRYACVNLCNYSTIEFRMFRGTLKYNTLIATLQLVSRICNMAVNMTDDDFTSLSWPEFVSDITEPELICYLKERRLYVNEPINEEEDD